MTSLFRHAWRASAEAQRHALFYAMRENQIMENARFQPSGILLLAIGLDSGLRVLPTDEVLLIGTIRTVIVSMPSLWHVKFYFSSSE